MKIVLAGYYGFDNLGDELILSIILGQLRARYPQANITALSADPVNTRRVHGINAVNRWNPLSILGQIFSSHLVVLGGGGLIQNKTSNKSLIYYLALVFVARILFRPVMLYAVGIETIQGSFWRMLTRFILNGKNVRITVRDQGSKDILEKIGISSHSVHMTADPVFSVLLKSSASEENYASSQILLVPRLPFPPGGEAMFQRIAEILCEVSPRELSAMLFQPLLEKDWLPKTSPFWSRVQILETFSTPFSPGQFKNFEGIVSARFHGLVLAALANRPFIGVGDPDKIKRLCDSFQMPFLSWSASEAEIRAAVAIFFHRFDSPQQIKQAHAYREAALETVGHVPLKTR